MKIGITKFGSIISEEKGLNNNIGHMLEIFNLADILSKEHEVVITNNLRKPRKYKEWKGDKLDMLIVFNGAIGKNNTTKFGKTTLQMLERYTYPVIETINKLDCPYIYIQPDIRYKISRINTEELKRQPDKIITLVGDEDYFDFDKLWLYGREFDDEIEKTIKFGLMYNDTNDNKTKKILNLINHLDSFEGIPTELKGKFKQDIKENSGILKEGEYYDFLKKIKYTVNLASNDKQITPRIWDCFMNDVVAFTSDFDKGFKVLPENDYLRIEDNFHLAEKIDELEHDEKMYKELLERQRSLVKPEYLDGSFILNKFNNLFKELI